MGMGTIWSLRKPPFTPKMLFMRRMAPASAMMLRVIPTTQILARRVTQKRPKRRL
jgi:hypothetical protein